MRRCVEEEMYVQYNIIMDGDGDVCIYIRFCV